MTLRWLAVLAAAGLTGCTSSGGAAPATTTARTSALPHTSEAPSPAPTTSSATALPLGATATLADATGTFGEVTVTRVQTAIAEPRTGKRPSRGRFVVVSVVAAGTGPGPFDLSPLEFYVIGRDGVRSTMLTGSTEWGPTLRAQTLSNGSKETGTIVFDAGPAAARGRLYLRPDPTAAPVAIWTY